MDGTTVILGLIIARLLIPLTILRWPLGGLIGSIIVDTIDSPLLRMNGLDSIGTSPYQRVDKFLDLYYLSLALHSALSLAEHSVKKVLRMLYFWRLCGVVLFEVFGLRALLFFAPNIFEWFYLSVLLTRRYFPSVSLHRARNWIPLLALSTIAKVPQEYVSHFLEFPWGLGNFTEGLRRLFGK